jgi:hypothetical protein
MSGCLSTLLVWRPFTATATLRRSLWAAELALVPPPSADGAAPNPSDSLSPYCGVLLALDYFDCSAMLQRCDAVFSQIPAKCRPLKSPD